MLTWTDEPQTITPAEPREVTTGVGSNRHPESADARQRTGEGSPAAAPASTARSIRVDPLVDVTVTDSGALWLSGGTTYTHLSVIVPAPSRAAFLTAVTTPHPQGADGRAPQAPLQILVAHRLYVWLYADGALAVHAGSDHAHAMISVPPAYRVAFLDALSRATSPTAQG